jgi:Ser/Thr protein kinase RdoA (MazF antagonist)
MRFDRHEHLRDGGSTSYCVFSGKNKYFMRSIKSAFFDTAIRGADMQVFLRGEEFPVPPVVYAKDGLPYVKTGNGLYILYEFIEGSESNPEQDAETIGELIGKLHRAMKNCHCELAKRDKQFFVGRYIDILRKRQYPRVDEFAAYGSALWGGIKDLPRGYCHGNMYFGNIRKTPDEKYYILDFDTSCDGFPMYDIALICDMTKYFEFDERDYDRSNRVLARLVPEYLKHSAISSKEIAAFHDLIAMQHFSTQATIMEIFGVDCPSDAELDSQLDWLYKWREQCGNGTLTQFGPI